MGRWPGFALVKRGKMEVEVEVEVEVEGERLKTMEGGMI
jgi:hypothetical protein